MLSVLATLVPVVILASGVGAVAAVVCWWRSSNRCRNRRSPLTRDLLRPAGHSLRLRIEDINSKIEVNLIALFGIPLLMYSFHISQSYLGNQTESSVRIIASLLVALVAETVVGVSLFRLLKDRRNHALGLDGELATAEELNQLMLDGCRVFHDVPIKYGNVDHVVVSSSGVYAVNTKCMGKPWSNGDAEVVVDHTNSVIRFPDRTYRIPEDDVAVEAKCLSDYLKKAVGKPVNAEPMIALPGWFVKERIGRGRVFVINPREPQKFFIQKRQVLSDEMVQQIAFQLERLCRDVEPVFGGEKGWEEQNAFSGTR